MARVVINNVVFYGFHGVYEYEREQGQKFFYDIEFESDDSGVDEDDLNRAVDYIAVCDLVEEIAENKRFKMLESLTAYICNKILEQFAGVLSVTVRVRKSAVPIHAPIDYVQVEETRHR